MQSIIEKLFYETVELPAPRKEKVNTKINEVCERLRSGLTDEQKALLLEFDDLKNESFLEEEKTFYTMGFQAGVQTLLEILDIHFGK